MELSAEEVGAGGEVGEGGGPADEPSGAGGAPDRLVGRAGLNQFVGVVGLGFL